MAHEQLQLGQFNLALESFTATLTEEQENDFRFSTLEDFRTAIIAIQNRQSSDKKMRNLARLRCFLEAMEQYGKVIEVFVNTSEFVGFIWGPAKYLLQIASAYVEAFDALLDAYQQIGESLPLLSQYQALFQRNPNMRKVLSLIYHDILEFHKKALKYFRHRTWRQLFHATWKTFRAEFSGLLANIKRHGRLVESQANLVEFEQLFHQMEMGRAAAEAEFQRRGEEERRHRHITVRNWLSAASVHVDQDKGVNVRQQDPGSGRWLLENNRMKGWLDPELCSAPLLWISGIPGAGKTVLTSVIVEELKKLQSSPAIGLGFFYCKYKDKQRSSFNAVARAILAQLLSQNEDLLPYLFEKASTSGEILLESPALTKELLEIALKSWKNVYIVIDGLDECDSLEKKAIISWFQSVVTTQPDTELDSIRCLFISQDDGDIGKILSKAPAIRIKPDDTRLDIQAYATIWSKSIQKKFELPDEKREEILSTVTERANGMFLFAKLVMENFHRQTKRENLAKELEPNRFPRGLEDAYARIVDRVLQDPATRDDAKRILGLLVCAKRPLKWREIQGAVSINLEAKDVDLEGRQLRCDWKELCGSLVEQRPDSSVELVHQTALFFLVDQKYINLISEEFEFTRLCFGYLNFQCFKENLSDSESINFVLKGYYSFLEYAAVHWVDHLEEWVSHAVSVTSMTDTIQEFLQNFWSKTECRTAVSREVRRKLSTFETCSFFEQLTKAAHSWKRLRTSYGADSGGCESFELIERISQVRTILEKTYSLPKGNGVQEHGLTTPYGSGLFKCPRINCKFFIDGFSTEEARGQHVGRHKRSFSCTYPACPFTVLGFNSARDLNRHLDTSHEAREYEETQFPILLDPEDIDIKRAIRVGSIREVEKWLEHIAETPTNVPLSRLHREAINISISKGDETIFRLLLDSVQDLPSSEISSFFRSALSVEQDTIAHILLRHSQFNPFDHSQNTYESPLATAVRLGRVDILKCIEDSEAVDWNECSYSRHPDSNYTSFIGNLLSLAALIGQLAIVKFLTEKEGINLESKDSSNRTPLSWASASGKLEVAKLLIENGVHLDSKDNKNQTPLLWASANGHLEVVKLLIKNGANIDLKGSIDRTPLSWASVNGHLEVVKLLIENGVDLNSKDNSDRTPLSWASANGHLEVVKLLIENGANLDLADNKNQTPLSWASFKGHLEVVKLLIKNGANIDLKGSIDRTPLSWASANGHLEVVKQLIKNGVHLDSKDNKNQTPLLWALANGHLEVVKLLIENGANIDLEDYWNQTPLSWASENGHLEVVKLLIENGADLDSKDNNNQTPLSWALVNGHLEVVKLLIENGVDLDIKDSIDRTPLWWAVTNKHLEVIKLIIENGMDTNSKDSGGGTLLFWAVRGGSLECIKLLVGKGDTDLNPKDNSGETPLSWAVGNGHLQVAQLLVKEDRIDINCKDSSGRTPLSWAAGNGHLQLVELLVEKEGINLNSEDSSGRTPLWCAARNGHLEVVKLLVEKEGVILDSKDSSNRTPLWWAAGNGHLQVVKLLVEKEGIDLESTDSTGRTPLMWAAENGHAEVVKLLVEKGCVDHGLRQPGF